VAKAASIEACNVFMEAASVESSAASRAANRASVSVVNLVRALSTVEVNPAEEMTEA
jgi:hypothetical protein